MWSSSGQGRAVTTSLQSIQECVQLATAASSGRTQPLNILPGSGINARTIEQVAGVLIPMGVHEFHMSGGSWVNGSMEFRKESMGMGVGGPGEWGVWRTSKDEVMNVRRALDAYSTY
jgi:copper homeostasis protein